MIYLTHQMSPRNIMLVGFPPSKFSLIIRYCSIRSLYFCSLLIELAGKPAGTLHRAGVAVVKTLFDELLNKGVCNQLRHFRVVASITDFDQSAVSHRRNRKPLLKYTQGD